METIDKLNQVLQEGVASGVFPSRLANVDLEPQMTLGHLGIDETGRVELMEELMTVAGKMFSLEQFHDDLTVAEIIRIVDQAKVDQTGTDPV